MSDNFLIFLRMSSFVLACFAWCQAFLQGLLTILSDFLLDLPDNFVDRSEKASQIFHL